MKTEPTIQDVARWWSAHNQDYVDHKGTYQQADLAVDDEGFLAWTRTNDQWFREQAYFAQPDDSSAPLFGGLIDYAGLSGKRVLEIGCGLGSHAEEFARQGARLLALDLSAHGPRVTRRRLSVKDLSGTVVRASAENLPLRSECVQFVWSWGVIHHTPDTVQAVREIQRVLKPGGRFAVMIYHLWSWWAIVGIILRYGVFQGKLLRASYRELLRAYSDGRDVGGAPINRYYSRQHASRLFAGFSNVSIRTFGTKAQVLHAFPTWFGIRRFVAKFLSDRFYNWFFARFGHLMLIQGRTNGGDDLGQHENLCV